MTALFRHATPCACGVLNPQYLSLLIDEQFADVSFWRI